MPPAKPVAPKPPPASAKRSAAAEKATPVFPIDVDRATASELEALPRIGPALAARIVAEREANGPFRDIDALDKRVKGIGPALVRAIQPLVTFSSR